MSANTTKAKITVVIADDHALLREAMRSVLDRQHDIEVIGEASDGEEAVRLVSQLRPDMVIMDIVMPNMNGIEATKEIKKISPSTAVIILTAYDDPNYVVGLLQAGASGYLLKSARGRDVVSAVRTVKAGESVLHPSIIVTLLKRAVVTSTEDAALKSKENLTEREIEVLRLAATGMSNKEIAKALSVTLRTTKAHLTSIFAKMNVASRTEAILKAVREGWLKLDEVVNDIKNH